MWPDTLPEPQWDGPPLGVPVSNAIRTSVDGGPAKQRRRFTAVPRSFPLQFSPVTDAALTEFETFFRVDLEDGVLPFQMPHPFTGVLSSFRFNLEGVPWNALPIGKDANRLTVELELLP